MVGPSKSPPPEGAEQIGFLILPEFPIYALIVAIETLRVANQNSGRRLFSWHLFSVDGKPVKAGNGMTMTPEAAIADVPYFPTVIVCAGNRPVQYITSRLLNWLRRLDRHGARLGALDTGAFTLAAAGLLDGYRATLHWEAITMFREEYPDIPVTEQLYVVDRNRITCAGGMATVDMMLHLIEERQGHELAEVVTNGFVHRRARHEGEPQRSLAPRGRLGLDPPLQRLVELMEENLEAPLTPRQLARRSGMSVRQVERLFRSRFNESPMRHYLKIRLLAARAHLFYGEMAIQDIGAACGFSAPSVFSRAFRGQFGLSPREFRQQFGTDQLRRFRPDMDQRLGA
ncbi:MAG: GlxA family transcriptional regulator [Dongiaceae bacterium]